LNILVTAHQFNPVDHFASIYNQITRINFLQFSEKHSSRITRGLAFHKRLRCRQRRELLGKAGFGIVVARTGIDDRSLDTIRTRRMAIHTDFQNFSSEELAEDYTCLVVRKPHDVTSRQSTARARVPMDLR
jgi:hypothetical protein